MLTCRNFKGNKVNSVTNSFGLPDHFFIQFLHEKTLVTVTTTKNIPNH